ncbi:MAG TPA: histidine kinase dimerization/phospho-acceptor domain-containing protein, partial [Thermoanaerobaculia bacterium]|nr:histidine kinase dimerization/phospho-acceptor domain-containing protein [Thermoanaerobaculia bacterium]
MDVEERKQTDESLRLERERADRAIDEELAGIDGTADEVIARARQRADEVLAAARAKMDGSPAPAAGAQAAGSVDRARVVEDRDLREERTDADEKVREERAEHVAMLRVERVETDKDLSRVRARADAALATRDDFLGFVSHDLRGLLNTIVLQAMLISREVLEEDHVEPVGKLANRIQLASGRMNRLIGDLVDVASIEAGALAVTLEVTDPAEVLVEAASTFEANAASSGIAFLVEIASPLPPATLDAARILQVLGNLLENALKFTPARGRVVLRAERVGPDIHVAVSDTG